MVSVARCCPWVNVKPQTTRMDTTTYNTWSRIRFFYGNFDGKLIFFASLTKIGENPLFHFRVKIEFKKIWNCAKMWGRFPDPSQKLIERDDYSLQDGSPSLQATLLFGGSPYLLDTRLVLLFSCLGEHHSFALAFRPQAHCSFFH